MTLPLDEVKMVILVNNQLGMGCGKVAAQVGHASCYCFDELKKQIAELHRKRLWNPYHTDEEIDSQYDNYVRLQKGWNDNGTKKIVLKIDDESELRRYLPEGEIGLEMIKERIIVCPVIDLGLTQIGRNSLTCIGFGPEYVSKIDKYTGGYELLD